MNSKKSGHFQNFLFVVVVFLILFGESLSNNFIVIQSTTSTRDSGFYEYLLPKFEKKFGFSVRVVAVGTGQAIRNAKNCDGDLLFVHHKASEEKFVSEGFGLYRKEIMYNDFVIVGPKDDPIEIRSSKSISDALQRVFSYKHNFISRGDDSGTHKKEVELWEISNLLPNPKLNRWYFDVGQGMGATLNIAVQKNAYTITDRASWVNFKNKSDHEIMVENEPKLYNYYGIIPVNPYKCPKVKSMLSKKFVEWLVSTEGKKHIENFKLNGQQLFFAVN